MKVIRIVHPEEYARVDPRFLLQFEHDDDVAASHVQPVAVALYHLESQHIIVEFGRGHQVGGRYRDGRDVQRQYIMKML